MKKSVMNKKFTNIKLIKLDDSRNLCKYIYHWINEYPSDFHMYMVIVSGNEVYTLIKLKRVTGALKYEKSIY